jgi:hypothetical protein
VTNRERHEAGMPGVTLEATGRLFIMIDLRPERYES